MLRVLSRLSMLALPLALGGAPASAQQIHYTYTGTITHLDNPVGHFAGVVVGDPFTITVHVDAAAQGDGDATSQIYTTAVLGADIDIGGITSSAPLVPAPVAGVVVYNDEVNFGCLDSFESVGVASTDYISFFVQTADHTITTCPTALTSTALPLSLDLGEFETTVISLTTDSFELPSIHGSIGAVSIVVDPSFVELCQGDGGNQLGCTNCPCGNNAPIGSGGGCLNSSGNGTRLIPSGSTSVSLPSGDTADLRFGADGAPAGAFCILNSGDAVAPGNMANPCFGLNSGAQAVVFDGLRCAIIGTRRHGGRSADASGEIGTTNNPWGGEGGPSVGLAVAGGGFAAGQTRFFQLVNREDPLAVCMRGLNTSQAVEVTFTP